MQFEIVILAGGLSTRMGRDKAGLRLGGVTMLGRIKRSARATGWPVRVIRRDLIGRCGPLGGVFTALKTTTADAVICLACDMPLVSTRLIAGLAERLTYARKPAVTCIVEARRGFPLALRREAVEMVEDQLRHGELSLQQLLDRLQTDGWELTDELAGNLLNVNTPEDLKRARTQLRVQEVARHQPGSTDSGQS